jgi:hypothetical protein
MAQIVVKAGELAVSRGVEKVLIGPGEPVLFGDEIVNQANQDAVVEIGSFVDGQIPSVLTLQAGASAKIQRKVDDATGIEQAEVVPTCEQGVVLDNDDEELASGVLAQTQGCGVFGLVGGGLLAAGSGPLTAAAAAGGLLLLSDGDDEASTPETTSGGNSGVPPSQADQANGLAGTVDNVSEGVAQTPAAPLTQVLEPVAQALTDVGSALNGVSEQDPTGVVGLIAEVVGVAQPGGGSTDSGLVGGVNGLASALDAGTKDTPLAPLVEPLANLVGSDSGNSSGVASALAGLGSVLTNDESALNPLTSGLLGPVVGGAGAGNQGLPSTLNQVADGLMSLTATDSALAPLSPVTSGVAEVVNTLADGLSQVGQALDENKDADPTGVVDLLAEVFGAPVEAGVTPQGPQVDESTTGVAGVVGDVDSALAQTALEPLTAVTGPVAGVLLTVGDAIAGVSEQDPTGLTSLLGNVVGTNDTKSSTDTGLVGAVNALATGLDKGTEDTPLDVLIDPLSRTLGSDESQTSGVALGLSELGGVLSEDVSPLAPLTAELLGPVVGIHEGSSNGLPGTLDGVSSGLEELTNQSALEPLSPVTDGLGALLSALSEGIEMGGDALAENASVDPTGTLGLLAEVLGGEVNKPEPTPRPEGETINGVAGLLDDVGTGLLQTPLAPVAGITDALASGLVQAGDALGGVAEQDPTGLATLLTNVLGTTETGASEDTGLVGGINALATGLDEGTTGTPLEALIDPVADLLGSQEGSTSGVAAGVGALGTTLALDSSPLAPLTSGLLSPIVGQASGVESGLPTTLDTVADGLTDLTSDSALQPLSPVTEGLSSVVKAVSNGCRGIGRQISEFAQDDPSGVSALVGDLLGGSRGRGRSIGRRDVDSDLFDSSSLGLDSLV